jgi:hypothetical protein
VKEFGGLEFFHMADFVAREGIYKNWTEDERKDRLARLIAIISRNVVGSFIRASLIRRDDTRRQAGLGREVIAPHSRRAAHRGIRARPLPDRMVPARRVTRSPYSFLLLPSLGVGTNPVRYRGC